MEEESTQNNFNYNIYLDNNNQLLPNEKQSKPKQTLQIVNNNNPIMMEYNNDFNDNDWIINNNNNNNHDNHEKNESEDYQILEIIGSGTYGTVYKGIMKKTNELIAIKKIKIEMENEGVPSNALREISILQELNHPNIVKLLSVKCKEHKLYLLFELLNYDLKKYLESIPENLQLHETLIKSYMHQLLLGVAYSHSKKVVHRDLKPANLLINEDGQLKIADFGLARVFSIPIRPYTKEVLTLWYRAPEILLGCLEYNTSVDIWSVGCIFAELLLKKPLFQGEYDIDQLYKIFKIKGTPNTEMWSDVVLLPHYKKTFPQWQPINFKDIIPNMRRSAIDLLNRLLAYDPNLRITAKQALNHVSVFNIFNLIHYLRPYFQPYFQ